MTQTSPECGDDGSSSRDLDGLLIERAFTAGILKWRRWAMFNRRTFLVATAAAAAVAVGGCTRGQGAAPALNSLADAIAETEFFHELTMID